MLYVSMAHRVSKIIRASTALVIAAAALAGCATSTQPSPTVSPCIATLFTFVGFGEGLADIQQDGKLLWEGRLAQYDPSTDISGEADICAQADREILVRAGGKIYRASIPNIPQRHFVLINSRTADPTVQDTPLLLD